MYPVISVLVIIVSILMILIVLVQNSKGGGLASNFSSSNQVMGVRKTTDFLEKATWTLAGSLLVLAFVSVMTLGSAKEEANGLDEKMKKLTPASSTSVPNFQVAEPQQQQENAAQPKEEEK
ncbi:MAG: preprotein translocase subunit SecG [Breznakibacter sp.]